MYVICDELCLRQPNYPKSQLFDVVTRFTERYEITLAFDLASFKGPAIIHLWSRLAL